MKTDLKLELSSFIEEKEISGVSFVDYCPNGDIYIYFEHTIYEVALGLLSAFAVKHGLLYFVSTNSRGLYLLMYR